MLLLVLIDLAQADLPLFEEYEEIVLSRLNHYGGGVVERVRSNDKRTEMHLIDFPDIEALNRFTADPVRLSSLDLWQRCGASSYSLGVDRVP